MRAMGTSAAGAIEQLAIMDVANPEVAARAVSVRVVASAVNPADTKVLRGEFTSRVLHARTRPLVAGYDFSGVVEACGAGVDDLHVGDDVFGFLPYASATKQGTFAERITIARSEVGRKPASVSHATAAASATPGISAIQALRDKGRLREDQRVLVIGAAGGVGSMAVGVAKRLGAHVTGVCSTDAVALVKELGADEVVDRRTTEVRSLKGPFDVVFDTSAMYSYAAMRHAIAPGGAFVTTLPSASWFAGKLLAPLSGKRCHMFIVKGVAADLEQLASWLADGLRVPLDSTVPVRDLAKALERHTRGGIQGRIAIDVENGW